MKLTTRLRRWLGRTYTVRLEQAHKTERVMRLRVGDTYQLTLQIGAPEEFAFPVLVLKDYLRFEIKDREIAIQVASSQNAMVAWLNDVYLLMRQRVEEERRP